MACYYLIGKGNKKGAMAQRHKGSTGRRLKIQIGMLGAKN
jgi:hypothetical protein